MVVSGEALDSFLRLAPRQFLDKSSAEDWYLSREVSPSRVIDDGRDFLDTSSVFLVVLFCLRDLPE